jgi:hypothetical protein
MQMKKSIFKLGGGIAILLLSIACTPKSRGSFVSAIVGADDRKDLKDGPIEESVGYLLYEVDTSKNTKVKGQKGVHLKTICTAFASAEREVTTASHCYDNPKVLMQPDESLFFVSASGKKYSLNSHKLDRKQGLLVLTSSEKLKPLKMGKEFVKGLKTEIISYRNDKKKLAINGNALSTTEPKHGILQHSMDTVPGSSGSPILQNGQVIAVHLGLNPKTRQNYGALFNGKVDLKGLGLLPESLFGDAMTGENATLEDVVGQAHFGDALTGIDCGSFEGVKIPCWTSFRDSDEGNESLPMYPYAKRENGCSVPGTTPSEYDNYASFGYNFSFTSACNSHDRCYYTLGTRDYECNTNFTGDLQAACTNGAVQKLNKWDIVSVGTARINALAACEARAIVVASAVAAGSLNFHVKAQKKQRQYLDLVQEYYNFIKTGKIHSGFKPIVTASRRDPPASSPVVTEPRRDPPASPPVVTEPRRDPPASPTVVRVCNYNQQANNFYVAFGLLEPISGGRWGSWGNHFVPSGACTDIQLPYAYQGRLYPIGYDQVRKDIQWGDGTISFCRGVDNASGTEGTIMNDIVNCNAWSNTRRVVAGNPIDVGPGITEYTFH